MGSPEDGERFDVPAALPEIRRFLLARREVEAWPALRELVQRPVRHDALPCWDWALLASRAVGGREAAAVPAATAVFCLFYAVHLVDDLLDEDPEGAQHRHGTGGAANLASAFQGLASLALDAAALDAARPAPRVRAWAQERLGEAAVATAFGQHLDAADGSDEDEYWRIARAKTPPLFVLALGLGAAYGGADVERAGALAALGEDLGLLVQVSDDLADAMARPAAVDWRRQGTNLAIAAARSGEHDERSRFRSLQPRVAAGDEAALVEAQEILLRCGAVSYCVYRMIEHSRAARDALRAFAPADEAPILHLVDHLCRPVVALLGRVGVEAPEELLAACTSSPEGV